MQLLLLARVISFLLIYHKDRKIAVLNNITKVNFAGILSSLGVFASFNWQLHFTILVVLGVSAADLYI